MRKTAWLGLLGMAALLSFVPAVAHEEEEAEDSGAWKFHGEIRGRLEYLENYFDLQSTDTPNDGNDDENSYVPYRVRMAMDGRLTDNVHALVELNYVSVYGGEDPVKDSTFVPGQGGSYYSFFPEGVFFGESQGVRVYQAIMQVDKIGGTNFDLKVGRMEHTFGTELFLGDNDFYGGTSFDGARLMWNGQRLSWDAFYYIVQEGNFEYNVGDWPGSSSDVNMFGATATWNISPPWGQVQGYYLNLQHLGFNVHPFSNFGLPPDSKVQTVGARWGRTVQSVEDVHGGHFDWNIEAAQQFGDAGEPFPVTCGTSATCDLEGMVAEGWLGFNFAHGTTARSRVKVGFYSATGDDEETDGEIEAFIPLFGDFHGRLGLNDFWSGTNIDDVNVGYEGWFGEGRHMIGLYYHMFMINDPFADEDDDLGNEIDAKYAFQWKPNLAVEVGTDILDAGDAFASDGFEPDAVMRAYVQMRTRW
jgi:hypothetical protein